MLNVFTYFNAMLNVLTYFNAVVLDDTRAKTVDLTLAREGYVLDFTPTAMELRTLRAFIVPDPKAKTFFSTKEITTLSLDEKWIKQVLHYVLVYGCGAVVDIPRAEDGSQTVPMKFIRGIRRADLITLVRDILTANKPAKDTAMLAEIIAEYKIPVTFSEIRNNELRIALYTPGRDVFTDGDDAVRYIVKVCADSDLLIKSKRVVAAVRVGASKLESTFVSKHLLVLAQVFNRHKAILLALKTGARAVFGRDINTVTRFSKTRHRAVTPNPAKTFLVDYMTGRPTDLTALTVRDKFKLLNLVEFKTEQMTTDIFRIRNGRLHVSTDRPVLPKAKLVSLSLALVESLKDDLADLRGKTVLFDDTIDYGLPVSRKQTVGQLPFGTTIRADALDQISAGVYWRNDWGATDIDLSTVDESGQSVGWGRYAGYDTTSEITFSGDVTNAPDGAMEFMTSKGVNYGLFVNIYSGGVGSEVELVIGARTADRWIDAPIIREKVALTQTQSILGFVQDRTFTVFVSPVNTKRMSGSTDAVFMTKARSMKWTVKALFAMIGVAYQTTPSGSVDYDLRYSGFTIDKLEDLLHVK